MMVKYMAPDVGYADASSAMDRARQRAPAPAMSQHQTAEAEPPAYSGKLKVVMTVAYRPLMDKAKEKQLHRENSRLKTYGRGRAKATRDPVRTIQPGHGRRGTE